MQIRTIVAGTAALALLAGCGSSGGTTGTPTPTSQPTGTGQSGGAPKVGTPLDVTVFEAAPCTAVTPAQVEAFGLTGVTGKVNTTAPGKACLWTGVNTAARSSPGLVILPDGTNLGTIYANKDNGTYAAFEELPAIQGYPAALTLAADLRAQGNCEISVGVSDDRAILFTFSSLSGSPRFADPCGSLTEFANLAITTIKAGAK
ncbi:hypothetical protein BBK82_04550 [Lentzea guizhouensis]|uniref:DUF3558 domain-containing protein n=1 Tax=Lentzea guizhouensis TaxID=1586287 RepID=A0A1B2HCL2_9PSEU|nr:DUF3558 domain-containing protein [Lentzea guizhouensis]ANZ35458.1 hypothetical protein BBK82_04550 [Lentzea guizhouensis]